MAYQISDFKQAVLGAFVAAIGLYAIRAGDPLPYVNPFILIIITTTLLYIYYIGFKKILGEDALQHLFIDYIAVYIVCLFLASILGVLNTELLNPETFFSSTVIIGTWLSFTAAAVFDLYNITNPLKKSDFWAR
ncbi:MAG: hypothetical protein ACP5D2_02720 [Candidatus Nanoarchaeia archaeon]